MRMLRTGVCSLAAVLFASLAAHAEPPCTPVNTPIVTTYSMVNCQSPVGICTTGTVQLRNETATTAFRALTATPGADPEITLYTGELVITTREGTITLRDYGILNGNTGQFFELQQVVGGTKKYKSATGLLTAQGMATGTGFSGTLTGAVCRVHGPHGDG